MSCNEIPKVFISYAWTNDEYTQSVRNLVDRLLEHGVDVVFDKYDLKPGHDIHSFMEQSVLDKSIRKVLVICNEAYQQRANERSGGVGTETLIISPEVYAEAQQEKFIPVIFETNEAGEPFCPTYLKGRYYFNLSNDTIYENGYEELLRNIYEKPLIQKPALGKKPAWLEETSSNYAGLVGNINALKKAKNATMHFHLVKDIQNGLITHLHEFDLPSHGIDAQLIVEKIEQLNPLHKCFAEFISVLVLSEYYSVDEVAGALEYLQRNLIAVPADITSYSTWMQDHFKYFIWEQFICVVAILLYYEKYSDLYSLIHRTYYLHSDSNSVCEQDVSGFYYCLESIEEGYNGKFTETKYISYQSKMMIERELIPILAKNKLVEADLVIFQMNNLFLNELLSGWCWFPLSYIYHNSSGISVPLEIWKKLKSMRHCQKLFPLFNVTSIDELKALIEAHPVSSEMKHSGCFSRPAHITSSVKLEEIGTLP